MLHDLWCGCSPSSIQQQHPPQCCCSRHPCTAPGLPAAAGAAYACRQAAAVQQQRQRLITGQSLRTKSTCWWSAPLDTLASKWKSTGSISCINPASLAGYLCNDAAYQLHHLESLGNISFRVECNGYLLKNFRYTQQMCPYQPGCGPTQP